MLSVHDIVALAYAEDVPDRDITCDLTLSDDRHVDACVVAKSAGVYFGTEITNCCIATVDPTIVVHHVITDGTRVAPNDVILEIHGTMTQLLRLERVMLNFIQRLSGIATATRQLVDALDNPKIQLLDTRKTTPLLRALEKQAVVAGGGFNHRHSLSDMVLIKENHLLSMSKSGLLDTLAERIHAFKAAYPTIPIEIEVETLAQIDQLPLHLVDIVMFDNFPLHLIATGAERLAANGSTAQIEISGNIGLHNIASYRNLPIQRISVGALTHSVTALDLSMRFAS